MATSRYLLDILLRAQVYLERAKSGVVQDFDPELAKYIRAITDRLQVENRPLAELSPAEMNRLVLDVFRAEQQIIEPWKRDLTGTLEAVAGHDADLAAKALDAAIVGDLELATISQTQAWQAALATPVQATGKLLESFVNDLSKKALLDPVETVIRNASAQGRSMAETVRALRGTKAKRYADGIMTGMRRSVEAMVRTAIQHTSNAARGAIFEANADIVTGERWIATLDLRTCQTCAALDHQVFPLGKGPRPPIHLNDRCVTLPELAGGIDLVGGKATRASKGAAGGAQVPASQTYYAWLKTQPAAFQDEAIGSTRGKLLRNGGLSAEEFARLSLHRNFEPMSLDEMRAAAPQVFGRANVP